MTLHQEMIAKGEDKLLPGKLTAPTEMRKGGGAIFNQKNLSFFVHVMLMCRHDHYLHTYSPDSTSHI